MNHEQKINLAGISVLIAARSGKLGTSGQHFHANTNIVFILEGGCSEKRIGRCWERTATDVLLLHAGEVHETLFSERPTRYIAIDLEPALFADYGIEESHLLSTIATAPDAKFLMLKIYQEALQADALTSDSIRMLFLKFASLSTALQHHKNPPVWIKIVREVLHDRWNETISLADLSKAAGVNPITISKHFPTYFACTLGSYVRKLRVEHAMALIKHEELSLTTTAHHCNFSDQSHFIRSFRQCTSLSPGQYRKM